MSVELINRLGDFFILIGIQMLAPVVLEVFPAIVAVKYVEAE